MALLKVASNSNPKKVAGALTGVLKEKKIVELQEVGAGAVNQGIKAIAIASERTKSFMTLVMSFIGPKETLNDVFIGSVNLV